MEACRERASVGVVWHGDPNQKIVVAQMANVIGSCCRIYPSRVGVCCQSE